MCGLYSKFQASLGYRVRLCPQNKNKQTKDNLLVIHTSWAMRDNADLSGPR